MSGGAERVSSERAARVNQDLAGRNRGEPRQSERPGYGALALAGPVFRLTVSGEEPSTIRQAAGRGVQTPAGPLPYAEQIQRAFGRHDVSGVEAHQGPEAAASARAMSAMAYATGEHVVFGLAPDLRTAAHEAAHVVQQRGGVQVPGGVGQAGDGYERHADAVADRVASGQSAEALLDRFAAGAPPGGSIQRMKIYPPGVLGTPGIEVENKDPFKKHIREWEKLEGGPEQIQKYLDRMKRWLELVGSREVEPKPGEVENVTWAVGWVENRLKALTPKPEEEKHEPGLKESKAESKAESKEKPKAAPSAPVDEWAVGAPKKPKNVKTPAQHLKWVTKLRDAALEGRAKLLELLNTEEKGQKIKAILDLKGEGTVVEVQTVVLIDRLVDQISNIYEKATTEQAWYDKQAVPVGEGTFIQIRQALDVIGGTYGWATEISDLNEIQMTPVAKPPAVITYDGYDISRAIRSIVSGKRVIRSMYENRERFLTVGRAYAEYQVGEGAEGTAGERRIVVDTGDRSILYYTNGATHRPAESQFQVFDDKGKALGVLYRHDAGAVRPE